MMLRTRLFFFGVPYLLCLAGVIPAVFAQNSLDARRAAASVAPSPAFGEFPITVECRVKMEKSHMKSNCRPRTVRRIPIRFARKTPQGTYLVPFQGEGAVRELDAEGKVVREFPKSSGPVGVLRLSNGNTLTTGDGKVTEYDVENDRTISGMVPLHR